jgi:transcriptional regulator NrdR family protein
MDESPKPRKASTNDIGLRCRKCGQCRFRVIYTRAAQGGKVVRRRSCHQCGARVTTWERPVGG